MKSRLSNALVKSELDNFVIIPSVKPMKTSYLAPIDTKKLIKNNESSPGLNDRIKFLIDKNKDVNSRNMIPRDDDYNKL